MNVYLWVYCLQSAQKPSMKFYDVCQRIFYLIVKLSHKWMKHDETMTYDKLFNMFVYIWNWTIWTHTIISIQHTVISAGDAWTPTERRSHAKWHTNYYIIHWICDNRILIHRRYVLLLHQIDEIGLFLSSCLPAILFPFLLHFVYGHSWTNNSFHCTDVLLLCDDFVDFPTRTLTVMHKKLLFDV